MMRALHNVLRWMKPDSRKCLLPGLGKGDQRSTKNRNVGRVSRLLRIGSASHLLDHIMIVVSSIGYDLDTQIWPLVLNVKFCDSPSVPGYSSFATK